MNKELTTDQLIASLDKEALREVLVTLVATWSFDHYQEGYDNGIFRLLNVYDKLKPVLEADEAIMRDANSLACDLNER